jgi:hypothetical protein
MHAYVQQMYDLLKSYDGSEEWAKKMIPILTLVEGEIEGSASEEGQALIEKANEEHCSDEIEIDDDAWFSEGDDGVWVQAWVWIPNAQCECGELLDSPTADGLCEQCQQDADDEVASNV